MKRSARMFLCCSIIISGSWALLPPMSRARVDLTPMMQIRLEAPALDVSTSADGRWVFVLVRGELLVYAMPEERWVSRLTIDPAFDRVSFSERRNAVILSSSTMQALKIVELGVVHEIAVSGLPFKGPEEAPVTIAVFSDYQ